VRAGCKFRGELLTAWLSAAALIGAVHAAFAVDCKPNHYRPPYFIKSLGPCAFDPEALSFAGTPVEQAMCLMRGMDATRNLAPPLAGLPPALTDRIGATAGLPSRQAVAGYFAAQNLDSDFTDHLPEPVSRAYDNDPDAPLARYFVIHDTSGPTFGRHGFPDNINDEGASFNNLKNFACADGWGKAHIVVNRVGEMIVDHDFAIPWRETKFEQAAEFGGALKGLFLHTELIQPRRRGRGGDGHSPDPAFTAAQYDRLALLYTVASVRAGRWLTPAFHAAIDADIPDGHDDPLNFDIPSFAASLDRLVEQLQGSEVTQDAHQ